MRPLTAWRPVCIDYIASSVTKFADTAEIDVTGPSDATAAILFVFDIFGYFPQTLQGADILSTSDKHHQYQVFMPDFFDGQPVDIST